jgi:hypothetical protein
LSNAGFDVCQPLAIACLGFLTLKSLAFVRVCPKARSD